MIRIEKPEFQQRIRRVQELMAEDHLDAVMVYGDEYRKENLRYVSNFWPIFERAMCFIPLKGDPVLAGAPEGERYAREMTPWQDVRNVKEFACVSVPEEIDYPLAKFSSFREILKQVAGGGKRLGLVGQWDIPAPIFERLKRAVGGAEIVDAASLIQKMRVTKSPAEIACLSEAGRQACEGYARLMAAASPGHTETYAAGAAEGAARQAGAEDINFMVFGSGPRTNTIIGRATERIIQDGDMIMAAMAVQYQGYVATVEFPFVAGKASPEQEDFLGVLFEAANTQLRYLHDGANAGEMVRAVRDIFRAHKLSQYDVYPPMHGIGLAEAESPYPNETSDYPLCSGMCVNSDISLFGHPCGSNRIEEGFVIGPEGPQSLTPLIRSFCERGVAGTSSLKHSQGTRP